MVGEVDELLSGRRRAALGRWRACVRVLGWRRGDLLRWRTLGQSWRRCFFVGFFGRELYASLSSRGAHIGWGGYGRSGHCRLLGFLLNDACESSSGAHAWRAVWGRRLVVIRIWSGWYRGSRGQRRRRSFRSRWSRDAFCELNVVCRGKSVAGALSHQGPIRVCDVVDVEDGVFLEGELLVGLAVVVVESFGLRDGGELSVYCQTLFVHMPKCRGRLKPGSAPACGSSDTPRRSGSRLTSSM